MKANLIPLVAVREMCWCYEVEVPTNYTALGGDLQVTIAGLLWEPGAQLELLQFLHTGEASPPLLPSVASTTPGPRWGVLGSLTVPPSPAGTRVVLAFPCGVVTKGGRYGVRLVGLSEQLNNLTRKGRATSGSLDSDKVGNIFLSLYLIKYAGL